MRSISRLALLVVVAAAATSCSIQPEAAPKDLSEDRTAVFGEPATGDVAAGSNRIYLLAPAETGDAQLLRPVQRDVPAGPSDVLGSLFAGPNADEREAQLDTAIPADVQLLSTRTAGQVLTIDINDVFDDLTTLGLRQAVATRRRSTRTVAVPPRRSKRLVSIARRIFACSGIGSSPTSSRNKVPR